MTSRAVRAIRFASRYGFAIDPATWTAARESAPALTRLLMERERQPLEKTMEQVARPSEALDRWRDAGALTVLLPSLGAASPHALRAAAALPRHGLTGRPGRRLNRFAAVLAELGLAEAEWTARHRRMSNADAAWVRAKARAWQAHGADLARGVLEGGPTDAALCHVAASAGRTRVFPLLRVCSGLWLALEGQGGAVPVRRETARLYLSVIA